MSEYQSVANSFREATSKAIIGLIMRASDELRENELRLYHHMLESMAKGGTAKSFSSQLKAALKNE